jgi:hypothetical protein
LINALQNPEESAFAEAVRKRLSGIAARWLKAFAKTGDGVKSV